MMRSRIDITPRIRARGSGLMVKSGGVFPFCLGREPFAGPTRVGIGLVPAYAGNRLVGMDVSRTDGADVAEAAGAACGHPVLRTAGRLCLPPLPSLLGPENAALVAAIHHKLSPGEGGHRREVQRESAYPNLVRPLLIVIGTANIRTH